MLALSRHRVQTGDTIVEVMIVLAVLGMAISISYATANRSLLNARQAQESSEATELVQTQVEDLRTLGNADTVAKGPTYDIFTQASPYCIDDPSASPPIIAYDSSVPNTNPKSCSFGTNKLYTVLIYNCDALPPPNTPGLSTSPCTSDLAGSDTSVVRASWPDVLGDGTDTATLTYRVHQ